MKNPIQILLFLMIPIIGIAQEQTNSSGNNIIYIAYGRHLPTISKSLNRFSDFNWDISIISVGVSGSIPISSARIDGFNTIIDTYAQISFYNRTLVTVKNSQAKVCGYKVHIYNYGKDIFPKVKNFDLLYGLGLSFGRYSLKFENSDRFTNPFIGLGFNIEPRIILKNISIGVKSGYDIDFSKKRWKPKQEESTIELNNFSASRLNLQLTLGFRINKKSA
jgi:hypothetical protein